MSERSFSSFFLLKLSTKKEKDRNKVDREKKIGKVVDRKTKKRVRDEKREKEEAQETKPFHFTVFATKAYRSLCSEE